MGFLSALFKKDWPAELAKAEAALEGGDTVQAYDLARRVIKGGQEELQERAENLLDSGSGGVDPLRSGEGRSSGSGRRSRRRRGLDQVRHGEMRR